MSAPGLRGSLGYGADVTSPDLLNSEELARAAQHECGHAVVYWAQGIPFSRVLLKGPNGSMVEPVPGGTRVVVGQQLLIQACGAIADYQRRGLRVRGSQIAKLLLGGDDGLFELDDPVTGQVAARPSRAPAVAPGGDLALMTATFAKHQASAAECIGIWRDCERFAEACRPAIDAMAAALLERGELGYAEAAGIAAAAMTGKPDPVIPQWAWPAERPAPGAAR